MFPPNSFPLHGSTTRTPSRGLGTFQVDPKEYPEGSVKASVLKAISVGYRHIDAALGYGWGSVEVAIGQAIKESEVPRQEFFIVPKLYAFLEKKKKRTRRGVALCLALIQSPH